jgi:hypothetical protein
VRTHGLEGRRPLAKAIHGSWSAHTLLNTEMAPMLTVIRDPVHVLRRRRAPLRLVFFGFLSWVPVFAAATAVQMWRDSDFPLFLAVTVVTTAASTALFASAYFRETEPATIRHGVTPGLTWMALHSLLGLLAFVGGPLQMPMLRFRALALCAAIIPVITVALTYQVSRPRSRE